MAVLLLEAKTSNILKGDHSVATCVSMKPWDIFNKTRASKFSTGAALLLAARIKTKVFIYSHLMMSRPSGLIFDGNITDFVI